MLEDRRCNCTLPRTDFNRKFDPVEPRIVVRLAQPSTQGHIVEIKIVIARLLVIMTSYFILLLMVQAPNLLSVLRCPRLETGARDPAVIFWVA